MLIQSGANPGPHHTTALGTLALFYTIMIYGFFMGLPLGNLLVGVVGGHVAGRKAALRGWSPERARPEARVTAVIATSILAVLCVAPAWMALNEPTIGLQMRGMLGLQFEVTTPMIYATIAGGGAALLAAQGMANTEIAERVGVARQSVLSWRARYAQDGLAGLGDRDRSGRPREVDAARVIAATLTPPAKSTGLTHWSSRELAKKLKIGNATVARIWREHGIQPWRSEEFRFSTDPELEAKVIDVVGLYLDPPQNAVVLCIDETSQIQALDRTAPVLPMAPHLIEHRSPDYVHNGTTTLFAALNTATGKKTACCQPRHRHQEFLVFCRQVARAYPGVELHLVMDNYAAHKHPAVKEWLAANQRIHVHFTPTHASWINMVEIFFGIAERQVIRRGTFCSVRELTTGRIP